MRKIIVCGLVVVMTLGSALVAVPAAPVRVAQANPGTNWLGEYFATGDLTGGAVASRTDGEINFDWGTGSPFPGTVPVDNFSVRWTKTVNFPTSGKWTFEAGVDDGIRVWIDNTIIINEWHGSPGGYATYKNSIDQLTAGDHDLKVEYYEATGDAAVKVSWYAGDSPGDSGSGSGSSPPPAGQVYGPATWAAEYFDNATLAGSPQVTRTDGDINFNWADGSPDAAIPADNFSARWTTTVNFPSTGTWLFKAGADDGVRVWIDSTLLIDEWQSDRGYTNYENEIQQLTAGDHQLKVEYYEAAGLAGIQVRWWPVGQAAADAAGAPPPPTPEPKLVYAAVTAENVNVRVGPGLGNPVITQVFYPDNYVVLGITGDFGWVKIRLDDGTEAWVSNEWVWLWSKKDKFMQDVPVLDVPVAPPASLPEPGEFGRVLLTGASSDTLNLRDGPSLYNAKVIGSIPQGVTFTVEAQNRNGAWFLISYQDIRGWVSSPYVRLLDGTRNDLLISSEVVDTPAYGTVFVPEDDQGEPLATVRGQAASNLKLRNGPSIFTAEQIGSVPRDGTFLIEGRNRNGAWYFITFEGQPGWVNAAYVTLIEGTVSDLPIR